MKKLAAEIYVACRDLFVGQGVDPLPIVILYMLENGKWHEIARSEISGETRAPMFLTPFVLEWDQHCRSPLRFSVFDFRYFDVPSSQNFIGEHFSSLSEMCSGNFHTHEAELVTKHREEFGTDKETAAAVEDTRLYIPQRELRAKERSRAFKAGTLTARWTLFDWSGADDFSVYLEVECCVPVDRWHEPPPGVEANLKAIAGGYDSLRQTGDLYLTVWRLHEDVFIPVYYSPLAYFPILEFDQDSSDSDPSGEVKYIFEPIYMYLHSLCPPGCKGDRRVDASLRFELSIGALPSQPRRPLTLENAHAASVNTSLRKSPGGTGGPGSTGWDGDHPLLSHALTAVKVIERGRPIAYANTTVRSIHQVAVNKQELPKKPFGTAARAHRKRSVIGNQVLHKPGLRLRKLLNLSQQRLAKSSKTAQNFEVIGVITVQMCNVRPRDATDQGKLRIPPSPIRRIMRETSPPRCRTAEGPHTPFLTQLHSGGSRASPSRPAARGTGVPGSRSRSQSRSPSNYSPTRKSPSRRGGRTPSSVDLVDTEGRSSVSPKSASPSGAPAALSPAARCRSDATFPRIQERCGSPSSVPATLPEEKRAGAPSRSPIPSLGSPMARAAAVDCRRAAKMAALRARQAQYRLTDRGYLESLRQECVLRHDAQTLADVEQCARVLENCSERWTSATAKFSLDKNGELKSRSTQAPQRKGKSPTRSKKRVSEYTGSNPFDYIPSNSMNSEGVLNDIDDGTYEVKNGRVSVKGTGQNTPKVRSQRGSLLDADLTQTFKEALAERLRQIRFQRAIRSRPIEEMENAASAHTVARWRRALSVRTLQHKEAAVQGPAAGGQAEVEREADCAAKVDGEACEVPDDVREDDTGKVSSVSGQGVGSTMREQEFPPPVTTAAEDRNDSNTDVKTTAEDDQNAQGGLSGFSPLAVFATGLKAVSLPPAADR
eukprot:Rmarinus@m.3649